MKKLDIKTPQTHSLEHLTEILREHPSLQSTRSTSHQNVIFSISWLSENNVRQKLVQRILLEVRKIVSSRGKELREEESFTAYAEALTDWICAGNYYRNLMITGGVGTGKTTLLTALHRVLNAIKVGSSALAHASVTTHEQFLLSNSWERVHTVPFLCLDDIGTEPQNVKIYGSDKTPIKSILEDRYATLSPTIITTNHSIEELGALYGDRVEDRLHEYDTIKIDFESFRHKLHANQTSNK